MQEAVKTFRYSARRSSYLNMIGVFIFLLIVEGGATEILVTLFVPILWLKVTIMAVTIVSSFYIIIILLYPLWTKHRLTDTHLYLHYGLALKVSIPCAAISNVQAVRKTPTRIQPASAGYEAKKQRIVACFSDQGMVLLTLDQPIAIKLGLRKCIATNILLNVDERDELLRALDVATTASVDGGEVKQSEAIR